MKKKHYRGMESIALNRMIQVDLSAMTFDQGSEGGYLVQRSGREFRQREKQVESPRVGSQLGLLQNSKETTGQSTMTNKMVSGKRAGS